MVFWLLFAFQFYSQSAIYFREFKPCNKYVEAIKIFPFKSRPEHMLRFECIATWMINPYFWLIRGVNINLTVIE